MKQLKEALKSWEVNTDSVINYDKDNTLKGSPFLSIDNNIIKATIQDGPIKEVGVNGIQITDLLQFVKEVYQSLDFSFPCKENKDTIQYIEKALQRQEDRTKDRTSRNVEGKNLK